MTRKKHSKKRSRGGIGCLMPNEESDANIDSTSRSTSQLLRIEDVPLSRAFGLLDIDTTKLSTDTSNLQIKAERRVRVVHPYPYTFSTFAKSRWIGRTLIDVYHDEFGSYPRSYYDAAIKSGRILVSGKLVSCDYLVKQGDELTHTVHRHEPAVSLSDVSSSTEMETPPIRIVFEDDNIIVVDKPASMPIHACGAYNYNTLLEVLARWKPSAYGSGKLFTIHRLDRLTSGLVLIAKNSSLARSLGKCILERDGCQKVYLARVKGRFGNLQNVNHPWKLQYSKTSNEVLQDVAGDGSVERRSKQRKVMSLPPIFHGEIAERDIQNVSGGVHIKLPMSAKKKGKNSKCDSNESRSCFATLGFWITDDVGNLVQNATNEDLVNQCEKVTAEEIIKYTIGSNTSEKVCDSDGTNESTERSIYWLHFSCPCRISSHKNGVCEAGDFSAKSEVELEGTKPAQTAFTLLSYDKSSDTSLLLVKPDTGRMHQIRLHLQALGHPIANDHCYGGDLCLGDSEGQHAFQKAKELLTRLDKGASGDDLLTTSNAPATEQEIYQVVANKSRADGEAIEDFIVNTCVWCARCRGVDAINSLDGSTEAKRQKGEAVFRRTLMEYLVHSKGIYLHALQYSLQVNDEKGSRSVRYRTALPSWVYNTT